MILVFAFGALFAAGIPLLLGLTSVMAALGLTALLSHALHVHESIQLQTGRPTPNWLDWNAGEAKATILSLPARDQIEVGVQEQLIVELYSK